MKSSLVGLFPFIIWLFLSLVSIFLESKTSDVKPSMEEHPHLMNNNIDNKNYNIINNNI